MHLLNIETLEAFLHHYGYAAIFLIVACESSGLPFPGAITIISASLYASATHALFLPLIILSASAGVITGDNIVFWVGHRFGFTLLLRYGTHIGLDAPRIKLGQYLFAKHGSKIIFFGRFISVLCAMAPFLAGANKYSRIKFVAYNATAAVTWASIYGCIGYLFGHWFQRLEGPIGIVLLVFAVIVGAMAWRFLKQHQAQLQAEADLAIPGPLGP